MLGTGEACTMAATATVSSTLSFLFRDFVNKVLTFVTSQLVPKLPGTLVSPYLFWSTRSG